MDSEIQSMPSQNEIFFGDIYSPSKCPSVLKLSYDYYMHHQITGYIQVNIKETFNVVHPSELKIPLVIGLLKFIQREKPTPLIKRAHSREDSLWYSNQS